MFQVGCPGGGTAAEEATSQPDPAVPAPRPGEHHHSPRRNQGGRDQAGQHRWVLLYEIPLDTSFKNSKYEIIIANKTISKPRQLCPWQ